MASLPDAISPDILHLLCLQTFNDVPATYFEGF